MESDRSIAIPYGGPALESGKTYQWRVRVWDGKGEISRWSDTARWTMGKIQPGDWSARWIGTPEKPGWGYTIEQGATTLWEQWNGHWSQIRSCFTSADNWLYQGLAGIRPDPAKPGFKNVIIQPAIVGDITWVKAHHDGPYGRIECRWKREGTKVLLDVAIPPNSSATIILPGQAPNQIGSGEHHFERKICITK